MEHSLTFFRHDVKIEFDKASGRMKIFGSKESIEALTEHVQSKISNCKTTTHVKLVREQLLFLKKFVFGAPDWLARVCCTTYKYFRKID